MAYHYVFKKLSTVLFLQLVFLGSLTAHTFFEPFYNLKTSLQAAPTVEDQEFSVVEGSAEGTVLGTLAVTSALDISSYEITEASFTGEDRNPAGDSYDDPLYDPKMVFAIDNAGSLSVNQNKYLLEVLGPVRLEINVTDIEMGQSTATVTIEITDLEVNIIENYEINWSTRANHPQGHNEATGGIVGDNLFVFSGFTNNWNPKEEVFSLNITNNSWSRLANMPPMANNTQYGGATHMGWTTDGTDIYVAAGYAAGPNGNAQQFASQRVYRYSVSDDAYEELPSLPVLRSAGALIYLEDKLYYVGGTNYERDEDQGDLLVLDLNNLDQGWDLLAPMPNPRNHVGTAVFNGQVYIFGGQKEHDEALVPQDDVHRYDPSTDTWTHVTDMPLPFNHIHASIFTYGDYIYSIGGQIAHNAGAYSEVYAYAPEKNEWVQFTNIPARRFSVVAGALDGKLYASGGNRSRTTYVANLPETFLNLDRGLSKANTQEISIYPNPARDQLNLRIEALDTQLLSLELFDSNGRMVKQLDLNKNSNPKNLSLPVSDLSAGLYLLRITNNTSKAFVRRVIIQ